MSHSTLAMLLLFTTTTCAAGDSSPGTKVVGDWVAWNLGTSTQLVQVRNTAQTKALPGLQAVRQDAAVLRKVFFEQHPDFQYYGAQSALELAIDEACKLASQPLSKLPRKTLEAAATEFVDPSFAKEFLGRHGDYGAFLAGSVFASVVPPGPLQASGSARLTLAAAIASCKDKPGSRFRSAQQRGFHFHMRDNLWALRDAISRYINQKATTQANPAAPETLEMETIKAQALAIAIKACRLTLKRLQEYDKWLEVEGQGKKLQAEVQFIAPIAEDTKWYSKNSIERVEKQLSTLVREYDSGATRWPAAYRTLPDTAQLGEDDFKILFGN